MGSPKFLMGMLVMVFLFMCAVMLDINDCSLYHRTECVYMAVPKDVAKQYKVEVK